MDEYIKEAFHKLFKRKSYIETITKFDFLANSNKKGLNKFISLNFKNDITRLTYSEIQIIIRNFDSIVLLNNSKDEGKLKLVSNKCDEQETKLNSEVEILRSKYTNGFSEYCQAQFGKNGFSSLMIEELEQIVRDKESIIQRQLFLEDEKRRRLLIELEREKALEEVKSEYELEVLKSSIETQLEVLRTNNIEAFSEYFQTVYNDKDISTLTINEKTEIINDSERIISKQAEIEKKRKLDNYIQHYSEQWKKDEDHQKKLIGVLDKVSHFENTIICDQQPIKLFYFFKYIPVSCTDAVLTKDILDTRRLVWDFKKGEMDASEQITSLIIKKLKETFTATDLIGLTFVCVPASRIYANNTRYKEFAKNVTSKLRMHNAFNKITIVEQRYAIHKTNRRDIDRMQFLSFDSSFFNGTKIILFDDVVTQGNSISQMARKLRSLGAEVICAIVIAKTVHHKISY